MIRRTIALAIASLFALTLCACTSEGGQPSADSAASGSSAANSSQAAEYDPMVETIDLTLDGGSIRFDHVEEANAELTDSENALVFVFDFTNAQSEPAQMQNVFRLQFFQNGAELSNDASWSSTGGEQYDLCNAFFDSAMKGGTVTFGTLVVPEDNSPITVMVSPNGAALEDNYQTMEVAIEESNAEPTSSEEASASDSESASSDAEEAKSQPIMIGDTASNDQFAITLTDARVDGTLSSGESSTYWESSDGGVFVILEFDVTALTSDQLPVDDYAITDLVANYNSDIYEGWTLQYIESQLWLYFHHTYLDANLPCHVYAYTTVPAEALNDGSLSVDMNLAGTPYTATIR